MKDINSLSHSKWRCKYHIVFAPKYRRQEIYGKIKADIGKILRMLCERKGRQKLVKTITYVSRNTTTFKCITIYRVFKK